VLGGTKLRKHYLRVTLKNIKIHTMNSDNSIKAVKAGNHVESNEFVRLSSELKIKQLQVVF